MASEKNRVLLFKNPIGGALYAQALLTVLCAPPLITVKLTTYRRVWVPEEVFTDPKALENRKALMICVDAERNRNNRWWVKKFYPVREVEIKRAEIEGDYLALWVETQGYIVCNDYDKYTAELQKFLQRYPPDEKSYIAFDEIRDLSVVSPEDRDRSLSAWQSLVESLARLKAFERAAFYTLTKIVERKSGKTIDLEKTDVSDPIRAYSLIQGLDYTLLFSHLLPLHDQRENLGRLEIGLYFPSFIQSDRDSLDMFGRQNSHSITMRVRKNAFGEYASIEVSPKDPSFKFAPALSIPVRFRHRAFSRLKSVFLLVAVAIYAYGQLAQATKSFPSIDTFKTISPELIGAILSSLMLITIPILISLIISGKTSD